MMSKYSDNTCEITIDGNNYFVPCDRVRDLDFIDNHLVNVSSSSIILKDNYGDGTTYPYISCSSQSVCYYRDNRNATSVVVNSDYSFISDPFKVIDYSAFIVILLFLILGVKLIWKHS